MPDEIFMLNGGGDTLSLTFSHEMGIAVRLIFPRHRVGEGDYQGPAIVYENDYMLYPVVENYVAYSHGAHIFTSFIPSRWPCSTRKAYPKVVVRLVSLVDIQATSSGVSL